MTKANFVFHGLFPDVIDPKNPDKQIIKVLFDVNFLGHFHSHLMADIELFEEQGEFEVRTKLPFKCEEFSQAAIKYYQYALGPQAKTISHSGPKGASIATNNVIRAQWQTSLDASEI